MRDTAVCDTAISRAIVRVLQCVALAGTDSSVLAITASTRASSIVRGAPGRGAVQQSVEPMLDESAAPLRDGLRRDPLALCDLQILPAAGAGEHDPRAQRQRLRRLAPLRPRP